MRQLLLLASLMGLFFYAGFALEGQLVQAETRREEYSALQRALTAAGASLDQVLIIGQVQVPEAEAVRKTGDMVRQRLGNDSGLSVKAHGREGLHYVSVTWRLAVPELTRWEQHARDVTKALEAIGGDPTVTVQLSGRTEVTAEPTELVQRALNSIRAARSQPWHDQWASSAAAVSPDLPTNALGVNVQVAVRRLPSGPGARVWVAWPSLNQEY